MVKKQRLAAAAAAADADGGLLRFGALGIVLVPITALGMPKYQV